MEEMELYDGEGNLIEDAKERFVPKEDAEKVRAELEEARKRLAGLENKDLNFKNLRTKKLAELAEEERATFSAREIELMQRQEAVEDQTRKVTEEHEKLTKQRQDEHRDDAVSAIVGDDDEMKKKVLFHYDRLKDDATTKDEIRKKVRDAARLAQDDGDGSPLFRRVPNLGSDAPRRSRKDFSETERGKTLAASLGLRTEVTK